MTPRPIASLLALMALTAMTAVASPSNQRVNLGKATAGLLYLADGSELKAPLAFTMDPSSRVIFVNDIPTRHIPSTPTYDTTGLAALASSKYEIRKGEVMGRAFKAGQKAMKPRASQLRIWEAEAKVYRSARDVVDSVVVEDEYRMIVYWKDGPEGFSWRPWAPPPPPPTLDSTMVPEVLEHLARGGAVLLAPLPVFVDAQDVPRLRQQVDSLRIGQLLSNEDLLPALRRVPELCWSLITSDQRRKP